MILSIVPGSSKQQVFEQVTNWILSEGFKIIQSDETRPWGGFLVIDESQSAKFISTFFDAADKEGISTEGKISPKILIVAPGKRLSWQYHHRRAEFWKVELGPTAIARSNDDNPTDQETYNTGESLQLAQGERHRLIGLTNWAVIAEIWQHTDPDRPSDEEDIIRVQDDFGR